MKDNDLMKQYDNFDEYLKHLIDTYGHTKEQWNEYVKRTHTPEIQSYRGKIGGKNNTSEQQSIKGKKGAIKSAQVRFEGSNEQTKPWEALGISRGWYYTQKRLGNIK